jgi:hypothetical protein
MWCWALGVEYARRYKADGIVSVPINPGNLRTELARDQRVWFRNMTKLIVTNRLWERIPSCGPGCRWRLLWRRVGVGVSFSFFLIELFLP